MLVSDAMTEEVVSVRIDRSLKEAVERMLRHDIGSIIVERDGDPTGIVTGTDVLVAAYRSDDPLASIPIKAAMSHPLVTISPDVTIRTAVERMGEAGVKRLAVTDGIELVGIVTQSDVVRNHSSLLREAVRNEERRQRLEREDDD